ncbi:mannonate dehydratase, partial [Rhizobium ruizarguesonis]
PSSWTLSDLERHRDKFESFGLILDMIQLPLPSHPIEKASYPDILLSGPERDRQIDAVCKLIETTAAAGTPAVKYHLNLIGIPRTPDEPG